MARKRYVHAWPPLVIGVEGLFWADAEERGLIDAAGPFPQDARAGPTA
jgi:hypothetical protein